MILSILKILSSKNKIKLKNAEFIMLEEAMVSPGNAEKSCDFDISLGYMVNMETLSILYFPLPCLSLQFSFLLKVDRFTSSIF